MDTLESATHSYISFHFSVFCDKNHLLQFYTLCQVIKECSEKSPLSNLGQELCKNTENIIITLLCLF